MSLTNVSNLYAYQTDSNVPFNYDIEKNANTTRKMLNILEGHLKSWESLDNSKKLSAQTLLGRAFPIVFALERDNNPKSQKPSLWEMSQKFNQLEDILYETRNRILGIEPKNSWMYRKTAPVGEMIWTSLKVEMCLKMIDARLEPRELVEERDRTSYDYQVGKVSLYNPYVPKDAKVNLRMLEILELSLIDWETFSACTKKSITNHLRGATNFLKAVEGAKKPDLAARLRHNQHEKLERNLWEASIPMRNLVKHIHYCICNTKEFTRDELNNVLAALRAQLNGMNPPTPAPTCIINEINEKTLTTTLMPNQSIAESVPVKLLGINEISLASEFNPNSAAPFNPNSAEPFNSSFYQNWNMKIHGTADKTLRISPWDTGDKTSQFAKLSIEKSLYSTVTPILRDYIPVKELQAIIFDYAPRISNYTVALTPKKYFCSADNAYPRQDAAQNTEVYEVYPVYPGLIHPMSESQAKEILYSLVKKAKEIFGGLLPKFQTAHYNEYGVVLKVEMSHSYYILRKENIFFGSINTLLASLHDYRSKATYLTYDLNAEEDLDFHPRIEVDYTENGNATIYNKPAKNLATLTEIVDEVTISS